MFSVSSQTRHPLTEERAYIVGQWLPKLSVGGLSRRRSSSLEFGPLLLRDLAQKGPPMTASDVVVAKIKFAALRQSIVN